MKITNINLRKFEDKGRLKAVGSITFDSEFVVRDVSVVEGKDGLFISMPSRKDAAGNYRNTAFPISKELRAAITDEVLSAYKEKKEDDADE